jgi:hypothetical protein
MPRQRCALSGAILADAAAAAGVDAVEACVATAAAGVDAPGA